MAIAPEQIPHSPLPDYFTWLGLPRRQALDESELERAYYTLQAVISQDTLPDDIKALNEHARGKYAHLSGAFERGVQQWASLANDAYQTLKHPLKRAQYLLGLFGYDLQAENNTAMPVGFLMEQMELREALAVARAASDNDTLERMLWQARNETGAQHRALTEALDERKDYERAAGITRQLMFQEKLLYEIGEALQAVEA
jgi:molecular chaperone HscB